MKELLILTKMQLKDKIDFSAFKSTKGAIFKVVLTILKFVILTALIYVGFYVLSFLRLVSLLHGIPEEFMMILFTFMYLISIVVCVFGMMKSFYFSKDNQVLLTMPTSKTKVFISKILVYYVYEFIRNLTYLLPLFVAYGMINYLPWYFFIWLVPMMFLLTLLPVSLGALLSIPLLFATSLVKNHKWLEYSLVVVAIAGVVFALISIINAIPANFDLVGSWGTTFWEIQDFMEKFTKTFVPFFYVVVSVCGVQYGNTTTMFTREQLLCVLGVILVSVVALSLAFLLVKPLFFKMTSTPFEYQKKKIEKSFPNKKSGGFFSMLKKEFVLTYRTSGKFYSLLISTFGAPILILLLNKIFHAMDTRLAGAQMAYAFNVLLIMIVALSSSINIAHACGEEGASSYLFKTSPKSYFSLLLGKLSLQVICMTCSILSCVIIMSSFNKLAVLDTIFLFLTVELFYCSHVLMSSEYDFMNSQTEQYQTTGGHHRDPNDVKSFLMAYLISAFVAVFAFFLMKENPTIVWIKMFFISALFFAFRIWLYVSKVKVYFKERQ